MDNDTATGRFFRLSLILVLDYPKGLETVLQLQINTVTVTAHAVNTIFISNLKVHDVGDESLE